MVSDTAAWERVNFVGNSVSRNCASVEETLPTCLMNTSCFSGNYPTLSCHNWWQNGNTSTDKLIKNKAIIISEEKKKTHVYQLTFPISFLSLWLIVSEIMTVTLQNELGKSCIKPLPIDDFSSFCSKSLICHWIGSHGSQ